jgi:hypothetical protein
LILGARHLHHVLTAYTDSYNHARPHQGTEQRCPVPRMPSAAKDGQVKRRDLLGGVIRDDDRRAA